MRTQTLIGWSRLKLIGRCGLDRCAVDAAEVLADAAGAGGFGDTAGGVKRVGAAQTGDANVRAVRALMVDVDGVLVEGQPGDGLHWAASMEEDLGFTSEMLHERLFAPHWEDIVAGRAGLMERVGGALAEFAPQVSAEALVDYWFARDARLAAGLLEELGRRRAEGMLVYLATNQEHLRAAYLMGPLGLAAAVDGIFYSGRARGAETGRRILP